MKITFDALNDTHFEFLLNWLEAPHIKKWWDQDITYTLDEVKKKFGSYVKGYKEIKGENKPVHAYIICADAVPIGYIQIYNAYDFPRSTPLLSLPENLGAFDIFIGEKKYLGQNLGSKIIIEFLNLYRGAYTHIFSDPDLKNSAAINCYEKAGFKRLVEQKETGEIWMIKELPSTSC